jgi:hypothetical protein
MGFGTHPAIYGNHYYSPEGDLHNKGSMGNAATIKNGDVKQ